MTKQARRRGRRASTQKLVEALHKKGLPSQAALAELIAEREGLSAVPRDSVNRAFRGIKVGMLTLQRIADALDTDLESLLLPEDEPDTRTPPQRLDPEEPEVTPEVAPAEPAVIAVPDAPEDHPPATADRAPLPARWRRLAGYAGACGAVLLAVIAIYHYINSTGSSRPFLGVATSGARPSIIVDLPEDFPAGWEALLRASLTPGIAYEVHRHQYVGTAHQAQRPGAGLGSDLVLAVEMEAVDRQLAVTAILRGAEREQPVYTGVTNVQQIDRVRAIPLAIAEAVRFHLGLTDQPPPVYNNQAVMDYVQGRALLENSDEARTLKRASTYFERAVEADANFGTAYAGLCETTALLSWQHDNSDAQLQQAERLCDQAARKNADPAALASARIQWLRMAGQHQRALEESKRYFNKHADDPYLFFVSALVYQELAGQFPEQEHLATAIEYASRAEALDPQLWRAANALGNMYFTSGRIAEATAAYQRSVRLHPNEMGYANLGVMQTCSGDLATAEANLQKVAELNPTTYLSDEMLGTVYFFQGDFQRSLTYRRKALEKLNSTVDIHQPWGALGDSYLNTDDTGNALDAYRKALAIVEADQARGVASAQDQIFKTYYAMRIAALERNPRAFAIDEQQLETLEEHIVSPSGAAKLAQIAFLAGQLQIATKLTQRATEACLVMAQLPELKALVTQSELVE